MKTTKKNSSVGKKVAVGVGVGLAAAAALYFLTGKRGKKNRQAIKDWSIKAHEEVAKAVKKAGDVSKEEYHAIADKVASHYKHLDASELKELAKSLRDHWKHFVK